MMKSTDHEAPHYEIISRILTHSPSQAQVLSTLLSKALSPCVSSLNMKDQTKETLQFAQFNLSVFRPQTEVLTIMSGKITDIPRI